MADIHIFWLKKKTKNYIFQKKTLNEKSDIVLHFLVNLLNI